MNYKITIFKDIWDREKPIYKDVSYVFDAIRDEKMKELIQYIREEKNKKTRNRIKKKLACILFSGEFSKRYDDSIEKHSGLICIDFDNFESEEKMNDFKDWIKLDKYTFAVFVSPSGVGLKVIVKIPPKIEDHRNYFRGLKEYYDSEYFDESCINESRVCYMSSDPDIYIDENSEVFKTKGKEKVKEHKAQSDVVINDSDKIIKILYSWWESKFGMIDGERNRNVYILAMAFNEFGINELEARNFCSQLAQQDFDLNEIKSIIKSAYSNNHLFGTKKFSEIEEYSKEVEEKESTKEKTKVNFHNIFDSAFIDVKKKVQYPPTAISVGTHFVSGREYPTSFGTYGNFSCLVGASKSRKTFFKSLLTASYIGGNTNKYASIIKSHRDTDTFVIDIDTEQSEYHAQKVAKRTMNLVGVTDHEFYKPFALRPYEPKQRLEFIEWLIYESDFKNNIGLLCIDGLADLVNDFNDLKESQKAVQKVMTWTDEKQFHLNTILHSNFGSTKAVGHIGSSVLKKAETVCNIHSEEGITTVKFTHTRGYPIEDLQFKVNEDGLPVLLDDLANISVMDYKKTESPTEGLKTIPTASLDDAFGDIDEKDKVNEVPF